jgi:hypothetical protein
VLPGPRDPRAAHADGAAVPAAVVEPDPAVFGVVHGAGSVLFLPAAALFFFFFAAAACSYVFIIYFNFFFKKTYLLTMVIDSCIFSAQRPEFRDGRFVTRGEGREVTRVRSKGTVRIVLNVVVKDMAEFGYVAAATAPQSLQT